MNKNCYQWKLQEIYRKMIFGQKISRFKLYTSRKYTNKKRPPKGN